MFNNIVIGGVTRHNLSITLFPSFSLNSLAPCHVLTYSVIDCNVCRITFDRISLSRRRPVRLLRSLVTAIPYLNDDNWAFLFFFRRRSVHVKSFRCHHDLSSLFPVLNRRPSVSRSYFFEIISNRPLTKNKLFLYKIEIVSSATRALFYWTPTKV